jgi:hypothetical protein
MLGDRDGWQGEREHRGNDNDATKHESSWFSGPQRPL